MEEIIKTVEQLQICEETAAFGEYFNKIYPSRTNQWAKCYQNGSFVNTNMYVESFHCILKYS